MTPVDELSKALGGSVAPSIVPSAIASHVVSTRSPKLLALVTMMRLQNEQSEVSQVAASRAHEGK